VLSVTEITDGIRNLSDAELYRFKRGSLYLSFGGARAAADLRHEAVRRAIDGTRKCPRVLPIVAFLFGVMRSIAHADRKAIRRVPNTAVLDDHPSSQTLLDGVDPRVSPEDELLRNEEVIEIKTQVLALFQDDAVAQMLVEGMFIEMEGKELQELVELDDVEFATKLFPMGGSHDRRE
jgi:DNA-directed RNA polymerase specialized sigma24 family protein